jgi:prepilin-type N-terminal cleavage/methylation domain-containing protein
MWLHRKPDRHARSRGFVLIEVLVTAAVAAVLLTALARAFSSVWGGIGAVREETEAMLVARAVIEASTPRNNLAPLTQEGTSGRYAWSVAIVSTGLQAGQIGQQGQRQPDPRSATAQLQPNRPPTDLDSGQRPRNLNDPERDQQPSDAGEIPWTLFRIAVVVRAPSGRRTSLETVRLSRPAAR